MKQIFSLALIGISELACAQLTLSAKANALFPTNSSSWKDISNTASSAYDQSGKNIAGFNVGLSAKISLPTSLFLMPEIYYTTFKNSFTEPVTNVKLEAKYNRVDVPVLVGYNVLGETLGVFVGPVASYNLSKDDQFQDFKENAQKQFTVGYQFGAQVQISKLILNARYEGAFSQDQRKFISNVAGKQTTIRYDNRPNLVLIGLGYKF
ncbi:outer membrane beta-barrel protein [Halpernia frigidisoli]|uniref:Outer membrane protein beta-barrel domain-containing protein n=1 Tax=Halpernia frigidisoli TaxID=1125876 RepID=A0A1I3I0V1_9FLAO|nr:outer membrane beta-barrel protein [Halpernia frigidisoli]SFI41596.1 Outer membrane protein beta-barrel domain-containing protein [Halpernia frigidisoli]